MFMNFLKKQVEKLYNQKKKKYTNETWLTQDEIDRIFQIAHELQK